MDPNQQIVQLLKRIQAALEEFKSEAKQQFSSNIDEGNWKAVDCLSECASWIDAGIDACAQMTARCASLEVDDLRQEASTSILMNYGNFITLRRTQIGQIRRLRGFTKNYRL